jgi:fatty-acyl-CoA synthase
MLFAGYTGGGTRASVRGLMSTGDVGRLDGRGNLFVEGREDDMIVSGGENVFPEEVENLLADHDAIAEVAVVGVADAELGQRLKAVVVRRPGSALSADDVRAYVRSNLARYKVPRDVEFRDALPRNETGKVLHRRLGASTDRS